MYDDYDVPNIIIYNTLKYVLFTTLPVVPTQCLLFDGTPNVTVPKFRNMITLSIL